MDVCACASCNEQSPPSSGLLLGRLGCQPWERRIFSCCCFPVIIRAMSNARSACCRCTSTVLDGRVAAFNGIGIGDNGALSRLNRLTSTLWALSIAVLLLFRNSSSGL